MKDRFYMFEVDSTLINLAEISSANISYTESEDEYILKIIMKNGTNVLLYYNYLAEANADLWKLYELLGGM